MPIDTVTADLGVNLDPVEAVVGDIDLPIDVNLDLSGINLGDANVPAGAHDIKIDVTDAEGRTKSETVSFTVVK